MVFERAVPVGSGGRAQAKRGTFALEPVDALPRLAERVRALAGRALETNPFCLPEFLEPAVRALGRKRLRLALFSDRDDLHFFAPVVIGGGQFGGRRFSVWAHPYAPLGTPLIDKESAPQVTDALIAHMRTSGRTVFAIPHLPLNGPAANALRAAAARGGFWTVAERQMRPILYPDTSRGVAEFDEMVSLKRRRELERQLRRLCELGAVSFMTARTATEIEQAFAMFAALEGSGWKGRRGTALIRKNSLHEFARAAVLNLAQKGFAAIDVMRLGDRPIAALIRLDHGGTSIPWKVAFDEEFSAYSPGKQLMCDETRRWLADPTIERVDPVCEEDNPMMQLLWPDREPYGTLLLSSSAWGVQARVRAGLADLKNEGKAQAKRLLRGRRKRGKGEQKGSLLRGLWPHRDPA
jgi:CelD/BcsL family acetyltransferase involved in cellulose biosynthesis